jgi:hypothetical protein
MGAPPRGALAFYASVAAPVGGHVGLSLGDTDGDGKTEIIHAYCEQTGVFISDDYDNIGGCTYIGWSWPPIKIIYANKEYLIKAKAPSENGDHTVWVQVVTNMGSADDIKGFSVSGEVPSGTVSVPRIGNVDDATKDWKFPTKYEAPVFRRGIDNPTFKLTLDNQLSASYEGLFEVYSPNDANTPIGSCKSTMCLISNHGFGSIWRWTDTNGNPLYKDQIPVGIYTVKGSLVSINDPSDKKEIGSCKFGVIFDFEEDYHSFVTWSDEKDYRWSNGPIIMNTYNLHIYDYDKILDLAIEQANGEVTREGAVDRISELARKIDGNMVFHHASIDESADFANDEYDNDFDGKIDDADTDGESWDHNYQPESFGPDNKNSGKAYDRSAGLPFITIPKFCPPYYDVLWYNDAWVDDEGNRHGSLCDVDKIAWYYDNIKMIQKDFDPDDKVPNPHRHSVGVCEDYAMLTVGYLRAVGVPSRAVSGWGTRQVLFYDCPLGHAWLQWYEDGQWNHLDTNHIIKNSIWEKEKDNPGFYKEKGITWNHVLVRNSEDINDVSDIAGQYNSYTTVHSTTASILSPSETICSYKIIDLPIFKPGENSTVILNITNPTSADKTINVTVILSSSIQPLGASSMSVTGLVRQLTIPQNSEITETFDLAVPGYASPGNNYILDVYENGTLAITVETKILAKYTITTEMPDEMVCNQPFTFSTTIHNNATVSIHNISVELDTHYYFNTTGPLRKDIAVLNTGESHTFTWSLTPIWYGDLRIDVGASTSDAGSETKMVSVPVLQTPELGITPQVPEKVEKGDDFFLKATVSNLGDIPSDPVILEITTPENVTANRTSVVIGTIGAHENKTCIFRISQNKSEDFVILLNATATNVTATNYAFINIIQPNMWIDILYEDETLGIEQHIGVIETLADEPCNQDRYLLSLRQRHLV